jgi:hypothetical protein
VIDHLSVQVEAVSAVDRGESGRTSQCIPYIFSIETANFCIHTEKYPRHFNALQSVASTLYQQAIEIAYISVSGADLFLRKSGTFGNALRSQMRERGRKTAQK